jgi:hypothetical protein
MILWSALLNRRQAQRDTWLRVLENDSGVAFCRKIRLQVEKFH